MPHELSLPSLLHRDFEAFSTSSVDVISGLLEGRPYGGLSLMWNKGLSKFVTLRDYNDPRIMGLSLNIQGKSILVLNVYMPCNSRDQTHEFTIYLWKIFSIISDCMEEHICLIGDFKAATKSARFRKRFQ